MKSSAMEHYYDEPTHAHVRSYKIKTCRTDSLGLLNHVEILRNFTIKYGLPLPQYIVYPDPNLKTKSFFFAQVNINDHFVAQAGLTSELAGNGAALKLLQLLVISYDLCDEDFYNNTCKETRKTKDQSVQTDPRPKYCNT